MRRDNGLPQAGPQVVKVLGAMLERQQLRLFKLACEKELLTPFLVEGIDADGKRFLLQVWVQKNGTLSVRDYSLDRTGTTVTWPTVMRLIDADDIVIEVHADDVLDKDGN